LCFAWEYTDQDEDWAILNLCWNSFVTMPIVDRLCSVAIFLLLVLLDLYVSEASQWWCSRHNCEELLQLPASVWNYYTLLLLLLLLSSSSLSRPAWGLPSLLYNEYQAFPRVKRPGRGADHPPLLAPRLKNE
jgi:hypothetical protein